MLKKIFYTFGMLLTTACFATTLLANTVTIQFEGIEEANIDISGFELGFLDDAIYSLPIDYNPVSPPPSFGNDFKIQNLQASLYWDMESLFNKVGDVEHANGVYLADQYFDSYGTFDNQPNNGPIASMVSVNTMFAVDLSTVICFDYQGPFGEVIPGLIISEEWIGSDQIVTISAVPDDNPPVPAPSALILVASGIIGLAGLRRRQ